MKKLYLLGLFILISAYLGAQTVTVSDKATLQAIPQVEVYSKNKTSATITDQYGKVEISSFKNADSIYFICVGFQEEAYTYKQLEAMNYLVFLNDKAYDLNTVVISASRFEEKMTDVPQQIQVIQAKQIEFMNPPTATDMVDQSGNVLSQKSQLGGGSPIIRGFEANKVLLVVDGVRMNNAIYRAGHLQNIITMDNCMLEKTEIERSVDPCSLFSRNTRN